MPIPPSARAASRRTSPDGSCSAFISLGAPSTGRASEDFWYQCLDGSRERRVVVSYARPRRMVPCEVRYRTHWGELLLWQAESQIGYCEAKADALRDRQQGAGWVCRRRRGAPPED